MLGIGERTLGINDQIMGALTNSTRKTATEVRNDDGIWRQSPENDYGVHECDGICDAFAEIGANFATILRRASEIAASWEFGDGSGYGVH